MNLWRLLIFMICLSGVAQAKDVTYVRVTASVPVLDEVVKNFNLVYAVEGDGFLQMIAVFNQTEQLWRTRLIRTDTFGAVLWSKDYTFYEGPAYEIPISNVPFSICESISGNGYVISGIWSAHGVRPLEHGSIQSPFYFEVGDTGQVVHLSMQQAYYVAKPNLYGFAPLKIKPVGTQGYVAVGVMSDSLSEITSTNRFGRICLLNDTFEETQAKLVRSEYAVTSNIRANSGTTFDAFSNVEVVEIPGQQYSFVVTGSVTWDLACESSSEYDSFGNALAFIGRFDDTLGIVWHKSGFDGTGFQTNHGSYFSFKAATFDAEEDLVYAVTDEINGEIFSSHPSIYTLDFNTGSFINVIIVEHENISSQFFYSSLSVEEDWILLAGYTYDDWQSPQGNPVDDELVPIVMALDKNADTIVRAYSINTRSTNYLTYNNDCYLCYKYKLGKLYIPGLGCSTSVKSKDTFSRAPLIIAPSLALFNKAKEFLVDAIIGPMIDAPPHLIYRPVLLALHGETCNFIKTHKLESGPDLIEVDLWIEETLSEQILDYILHTEPEYELLECE